MAERKQMAERVTERAHQQRRDCALIDAALIAVLGAQNATELDDTTHSFDDLLAERTRSRLLHCSDPPPPCPAPGAALRLLRAATVAKGFLLALCTLLGAVRVAADAAFAWSQSMVAQASSHA